MTKKIKENSCPQGTVWCPISKKCIPEGEQKSKGQGKGQARGQGKGPIGVPKKEDKNMLDNKVNQLVDEILLGDYSLFKKLEEGDVSVDNVLDEIENSIDHVPDQDLPELQQSVEDDLTKDSNTPVEERVILFKEGMKTELKDVTVKCKKEFQDVSEVRTCMAEAMKSMYHNWMVSQLPVDRITPIEEQMLASVKLLSEDAYKEFFKKMLSKYGVKTPSELSDDKKKEFFNAVDKGWKANKESD